jgi:glycosyltransferase involved in cell wall biosynthesis
VHDKYWDEETFCILRFTRLGKLPPGMHVANFIREQGFSVLAYEYGSQDGINGFKDLTIPRYRNACDWARHFPVKAQPFLIFLFVFFHLTGLCLRYGKPRAFLTHGLQEQALALFLNLLFRVPIVAQVHEIFEPAELSVFNRLLLKLEGLSLRRAALVFCPEETRLEILRSRYHLTDNTAFLPNCPRLKDPKPDNSIRGELRVNEEAVLLLYVGGIGKNLALKEAIEALPNFPTLHFVLVGWGDKGFINELRETATKNQVATRVHFVGATDSKWRYYFGSDIAYCVYQPNELRTRHQATASNKLFEAMAAGIPVVARDSEDFRKIVLKTECGTVAPTLNSEGVTKALRPLMDNIAFRKELGTNGQNAFRQTFHFENFFTPLFEKLLQVTQRAPARRSLPYAVPSERDQ